MDKRINIAILAALLTGSGYYFGTACKRIGQSFDLLLTPSKDILTPLVWLLLSLCALSVSAGLVSTLLRPTWTGFLAFGLSGVAILLGWEITLLSSILILAFIMIGILNTVGVERELKQRIKFLDFFHLLPGKSYLANLV